MFIEGVREDEDVVKINNAEDIEEVMETIIGISLERCGSIGETERHDEIFEVTIADTEGGFVLITFCNPELVVCICYIEAGEVFGILETIEKLRD